MRKTVVLIAFFLSLAGMIFSVDVKAQSTIYSTQSGWWQNTSTWDGGIVPVTTDTAVIADGHTVHLNDNQTIFVVLINATSVLHIQGSECIDCSVAWTVTLSYDDTSGSGFDSSSSGQLTAVGTASYQMTITTADGSPPPTNYWQPWSAMTITMDYTTVSYFGSGVLGFGTTATIDIDDTTFQHSRATGSVVRTHLATISSFSDVMIDDTSGTNALSVGAYTAFDNIVITNNAGGSDIGGVNAHTEFVNSNFDVTKIEFFTTGSIISDTHNDIANNYKIICTTLSKSSITNDYTSSDNIEIVSNGCTYTIDEDASSNNYWAQTNTVTSQDAGTIWTITSLANVTVNGTVESSGTMNSAGWYSFFVNYNNGGRLWLNDSVVNRADLVLPFRYSISDGTTTIVDELSVEQIGVDIDINITIRDFSVKDSGTVLKFKAIATAGSSTFTVSNLTTGLFYEVLLDDGHYLYLPAENDEISWTFTDFSTKTFEIKWVSREEALGKPGGAQSPIRVYTNTQYDSRTNSLKIEVWWIQQGGPETAELIKRELIVNIDGNPDIIPVKGNFTNVPLPWNYLDGGIHNITVTGAVFINWTTGPSFFLSDTESIVADNSTRALILYLIITSIVIISIMAVWELSKKRVRHVRTRKGKARR